MLTHGIGHLFLVTYKMTKFALPLRTCGDWASSQTDVVLGMMHKSTLAGYGVDSCRLFDVQPHERARRVHH